MVGPVSDAFLAQSLVKLDITVNKNIVFGAAAALSLFWPCACLLAADTSASANTSAADNVGFLDDYSLLRPSPDTSLTKYYMAPGASTRLRSYHSIMVDHPEVFIATNSPYKGFKPANLAVVAEAFRQAVIAALQDDYKIVAEPGPGVLLLRLALVNIDVTKDRLHVAGFTPVGLAYQAANAAVSSSYKNAVRHTSLVGLSIEGEVRDSQSSDMLGEFVDDFSSQSAPKGWTEFQQEMQRFGEVANCQLNNAKAADADRVNCRAPAAAQN
jgi:hypothetical protein